MRMLCWVDLPPRIPNSVCCNAVAYCHSTLFEKGHLHILADGASSSAWINCSRYFWGQVYWKSDSTFTFLNVRLISCKNSPKWKISNIIGSYWHPKSHIKTNCKFITSLHLGKSKSNLQLFIANRTGTRTFERQSKFYIKNCLSASPLVSLIY